MNKRMLTKFWKYFKNLVSFIPLVQTLHSHKLSHAQQMCKFCRNVEDPSKNFKIPKYLWRFCLIWINPHKLSSLKDLNVIRRFSHLGKEGITNLRQQQAKESIHFLFWKWRMIITVNRASMGFEPVTSVNTSTMLPTEPWSHILGERSIYWVHISSRQESFNTI